MYFFICTDGLLVRGSSVESGGEPFVQFGDDPPIGLFDHVRNLWAVKTSDGRHIAAWKSQLGHGRMVDRASRIVVSLSTVYGDEAIALTPEGIAVYITSTQQYIFGQSARPLPANRIGTSQGIAAAFDDGRVVFGDDQLYAPASESTRGGFRYLQWQDIGAYRIGKTTIGAIAWHYPTSTPYVITDVNTPWAIRGCIVNGELVCTTSLPGTVIHERDFRPWKADPIRVPEFIQCHRPLAVGAFYDHERPFLTAVDDGTGRFPATGPLIRGVFTDNGKPEYHERAKALASRLQVPLSVYGDGYGLVPQWGDYVLQHAYLTPGKSIESCTRLLSDDVMAIKASGRPFGGAISLHLGATDDPNVFKRDEQAVVDFAAISWRIFVEEGARFVFIYCYFQPKDGPIRDGILRFDSTKECYRRILAAVPDSADWPKLKKAETPSMAKPTYEEFIGFAARLKQRFVDIKLLTPDQQLPFEQFSHGVWKIAFEGKSIDQALLEFNNPNPQ